MSDKDQLLIMDRDPKELNIENEVRTLFNATTD